MAVEIGLKKFRLLPPEGPRFEVDEAAVMKSWVGEDGKKEVVLKETDGQIFEVDEEVLLVERSKKKVKFMSSDGVVFAVDQAVAKQSPRILFVTQANCTDSLPVLKVNSKILSKVLDYCSEHVHSFFLTEADACKLKDWDADFIKVDDMATLHGLVMAAYELKIEGLLDLACQAFGDMIKGKTPEEIRKMFNIENDFTPDEEKLIQREATLEEQAKSTWNQGSTWDKYKVTPPLHTRKWF